MKSLCIFFAIGLCQSVLTNSEKFNTGSDITTEFDDITERACNSSLQPAVITQPGFVYPPRFDNGTYLPDQDCRWLLQAPQGSIVSLEFTLIEVVETFRCHFANITVYDGSSILSQKMVRLCGHDDSPILYASQTDVLVVFQSGRVVEGRGFEAIFGVEDIQESGCASRDFDSNGWENGGLYSPNWPMGYPPAAQCVWRITGPKPVRVEFLDFDLEEGDSEGDCDDDRVSVYDLDNSGDEDLLGVYCGPYNPSPLGSTGPGLVVRFNSGQSAEGNHAGFRLRFLLTNTTERACAGSGHVELDWAPGLLISPDTHESLCTWRLVAPITRLIRLSVQVFDLPECEQCGCAGLEIYNGPTHNDPLIGRFCGDGWAEPLAIGSNQVFLQYDSYNVYDHKGFEVLYEYNDISVEACGSGRPVELSHDDGVITSPNYNQGLYPDNANCQWLISTTFGYGVTLEFNSMEIQHCDSCRCDYLRVHNGDEPTAPNTHIGTYCGVYPPQAITSTVPALYITFVSDMAARFDGFQLSYRFTNLADKACGPAQPMAMSHNPGEILSEGYELESYYKPNSECRWLITAEPEQTIELHLKRFDVEGGDRCEFDYLLIYDGMDDNAPLIARLCDEVEPSVYESSDERMYLKFFSNHVVEKKGFYFEYYFRESTGGSGIGFLPAILVCIVVLGVLTMVGAYCRVSTKYKKFRAWLRRVTGRNTSNEEEMQPPRNSSAGGVTEADRGQQDSTDFVPPPARSVVCPPSDIDSMHYYAIADVAPPTYEEATGGTNTAAVSGERDTSTNIQAEPSTGSAERSGVQDGLGNSAGNRLENMVTTQTGTSRQSESTSRGTQSATSSQLNTSQGTDSSTPGITESLRVPSQPSRVQNADSPLQSQGSSVRQLSYPGMSTSDRTNNSSSNQQSQPSNRGTRPGEIQINACSALGNPDMGVSLLRQTGMYRAGEEHGGITGRGSNPDRNSPHTHSNIPHTQNVTNPRVQSTNHVTNQPTHILRSRSVDGLLNNSPTSGRNQSNQRSASTHQLGSDMGVADFYNPVYNALQHDRTDCRIKKMVKDEPQGQVSSVEITEDNKKGSGNRKAEGDKMGGAGIDNEGYMSESNRGNSNHELQGDGNIVLHRLESHDTAV